MKVHLEHLYSRYRYTRGLSCCHFNTTTSFLRYRVIYCFSLQSKLIEVLVFANTLPGKFMAIFSCTPGGHPFISFFLSFDFDNVCYGFCTNIRSVYDSSSTVQLFFFKSALLYFFFSLFFDFSASFSLILWRGLRCWVRERNLRQARACLTFVKIGNVWKIIKINQSSW